MIESVDPFITVNMNVFLAQISEQCSASTMLLWLWELLQCLWSYVELWAEAISNTRFARRRQKESPLAYLLMLYPCYKFILVDHCTHVLTVLLCFDRASNRLQRILKDWNWSWSGKIAGAVNWCWTPFETEVYEVISGWSTTLENDLRSYLQSLDAYEAAMELWQDGQWDPILMQENEDSQINSSDDWLHHTEVQRN